MLLLLMNALDAQVGTPEIETAADYLLQQANTIKQLAQEQRDDLEVTVALEHVSGSASMAFMKRTFYNAYQDLSNIILRVAPKQKTGAKDVLISAHFDSTIGTSGRPEYKFLLAPLGRLQNPPEPLHVKKLSCSLPMEVVFLHACKPAAA